MNLEHLRFLHVWRISVVEYLSLDSAFHYPPALFQYDVGYGSS